MCDVTQLSHHQTVEYVNSRVFITHFLWHKKVVKIAQETQELPLKTWHVFMAHSVVRNYLLKRALQLHPFVFPNITCFTDNSISSDAAIVC